MTGVLRLTDRAVTLLVGLGLLSLGLAGLEWRYEVIGHHDDRWDLGSARDVVASDWFPWVAAVGGLGLALVALVWLSSHLTRPSGRWRRLDASDATGRLEADVRSAAGCTASRFATLAPVAGVRSVTTARRGYLLIEVRGNVDQAADAEALSRATRACAQDVAAAFADDDVRFRVVLDGPRRRPLRRGNQRVRVE